MKFGLFLTCNFFSWFYPQYFTKYEILKTRCEKLQERHSFLTGSGLKLVLENFGLKGLSSHKSKVLDPIFTIETS